MSRLEAEEDVLASLTTDCVEMMDDQMIEELWSRINKLTLRGN